MRGDRVRATLIVAVGVLLLGGPGCGGANKPVRLNGVLTWTDGSPISEASVVFMPDGGGRHAFGMTGKDGKFDLTTYNSGDGALPGEYKIVVTKSAKGEEEPAAAQPGDPTAQMKAM